MNNLILAGMMIILCQDAFTQLTIANGGFENWDNVNTVSEEPTNWNSIKTGSGNGTAISLAPQSCFRESNNPRSGTYCVRLETGSVFGQVAPGSVTTGRVMVPSLNASEGYIQTIAGDANFSMPFTGRPDSLVFWIRYSRAGNDFPSITAVLHVGNYYLPETPVNNNHPDSTMNKIATAQWTGPASSVASWTRYAVPFVYTDNRTPQYILIVATPTANSSPTTSGSKLWIDDMSVVYNPAIATGNVSIGPYYVSATTGAAVSVPFTLTGVFGTGNVVTAQLSDAAGSFVSPVNIGSVTTTTSGTINAVIPPNTPTGSGYRIRVVSSNPVLTANDNGSNISVVLVTAVVSPSSTQNILPNTNGNTLTVTEIPAGTSREWKYSTTSGTGYQSFSPAETGISYTPNFQNTGTYYVVCESQIHGLTVRSNEVAITVSNVTITTGTLSAYVFELSPSAPDAPVDVSFTVSGPFDVGNIFSAQLSDAHGSFSNPVFIGSINSTQSGVINAVIPRITPTGAGYRIRVIGSSPPVTGSDNGTDILIDQFSNSIAPVMPQTILVNTSGTPLMVSESQNVLSREWKYSTVSGSNYQSFSPAETGISYTPLFSQPGTFYVVCVSENQYNDEVTSNEVPVTVTVGTAGTDLKSDDVMRIWSASDCIFIDLAASDMQLPLLIITDVEGRQLVHKTLQSKTMNLIKLESVPGIYVVKVFDNKRLHTVKLVKY